MADAESDFEIMQRIRQKEEEQNRQILKFAVIVHFILNVLVLVIFWGSSLRLMISIFYNVLAFFFIGFNFSNVIKGTLGGQYVTNIEKPKSFSEAVYNDRIILGSYFLISLVSILVANLL